MRINRQAQVVYTFLKLFFITDLFFIGYYQNRFTPIGGVATVLAAVVILLLFLLILSTGVTIEKVMNPPILCWLLFAVWAIITSIINAKDIGSAISSAVVFFALVFFMMAVSMIIKIDGNLKFLFMVFAALGTLIAITIVFWGTFRLEGNIGTYYALSLHSNRNGEAIIMIFGIAGVLYMNRFKRMIPALMSIACICLQFYAILQGGSRKGAVGVFVLIVLWVILCYRMQFRLYSNWVKFIHVVAWLIMIVGVIRVAFPWIINSWAVERLFSTAGRASSIEREYVQQEAWRYFLSSPLCGIGYDQVRVYTGIYAHSNPIEVLADTGIIGAIAYYLPFLFIFRELFKKLHYLGKRTPRTNEIYVQLMFALVLFLVISLYEIEMVSSQDYMTVVMYGVCAAIAYDNRLSSSINEVSLN